MPTDQTIILLGYRGSGKTTVGRLLASRLNRRFIDTDDILTRRAGQTIKDIFEKHGEDHFRNLESAAIRDAIAVPNHVIALGGGAIKRESNRHLLTKVGSHRIYLHCDPAELHSRIHADPATAANRPSLTHLGGGIDEIRQLLSQREPMYREVATHEVDVTELQPEQVVEKILQLIDHP